MFTLYQVELLQVSTSVWYNPILELTQEKKCIPLININVKCLWYTH